MVAISVLVKIVLVVVVLIIVSLVVTIYLPSTSKQAISTVTSFTPEVELEALPCSNYCFAIKTPEEKKVLEESDDLSNLLLMPTYFTCNYQMLELATFAYELAKHKGTSARTFQNAVKYLFNCFSDRDLCDDTLSISDLCPNSPNLLNYPYIDCFNSATLKQRIPEFSFVNRNASDLKNDFVCEGVFDACNVEMDKYGDDCMPAWGTLLLGAGRCEDVALFYYTAFRTLGVADYTVSGSERITVALATGVCDLPCPCKILADECGLDYELTDCKAPSKVILNPSSIFGEITVCAGDNGSVYQLSGERGEWIVNQQNAPDYQASYYFVKSFDGYNQNDEYIGEIIDGADSYTLRGSSVCESYPQALSKEELITRCEGFLEDPAGFRDNEVLRLCSI